MANIIIESTPRHKINHLGDEFTGTHWSELMALSELDAVAIGTPPATHAALVQAALDAQKHVFVEKPLTLEVADAEWLAARDAELTNPFRVDRICTFYSPDILFLRRVRAFCNIAVAFRFVVR
jgi:predicted dehydrogenase